jgi:hypothetical protein
VVSSSGERHLYVADSIVQEGNLSSNQLTGQLMDFLLQLGECFLAFQGHAGLQIVHVHLQLLQHEVVFVGLAYVGHEHSCNEDVDGATSSMMLMMVGRLSELSEAVDPIPGEYTRPPI